MSPTPPAAPFDIALKRRQRQRIAPGFADAAFLHRIAAEDLCDRLEAVNRSFAAALIIGGGAALRAAAAQRPGLAGRIVWRAETDLAPGLLAPPLGVACDPEALPFAGGAFDLIVSNLALHWVNDLPGALVQLRLALKPDGLFLGAMLGGETLAGLRAALITAEVEARGGAGPRVAPFADAQDLAGLLQRAGFALPVADRDTTIARYRDPLRLLYDLRAMGETAALTDRPAQALTRGALTAALAHYAADNALPDGRLAARFDILTMTGWAPHQSQQQPLRPGAAKTRLADALGVAERSAGEKAGG